MKKLKNNLKTLINNNKKYIIFSAFGCGVFSNDPSIVSEIYTELIRRFYDKFEIIAFAINTDRNFLEFKKNFEKNINNIYKIK